MTESGEIDELINRAKSVVDDQAVFSEDQTLTLQDMIDVLGDAIRQKKP